MHFVPPLPLLVDSAGAVGLLGAGYAGYAVFYPGSQALCRMVRKVPIVNAVALTFDDGPTEPFTPRVLDLLGEHKAQATFFVIGANVRKHPELARRIVEEGHTIANHSWDHARFGFIGSEQYWHQQLARTNKVIMQAAGVRPRLFRPPRGIKAPGMAAAIRRRGMRMVGWRLRGFDTAVHRPALLSRYISGFVRGGDIITLHDGLEEARRERSQQATCDALPAILEHFRQRQWHCLSLAQAMEEAAYFTDEPDERTAAL